MKQFLLSIFAVLFAFAGVQAQETATLSFADKAQRTSYSTSQQVWEQNGITFTNNKASSTTNVADYSNPVRLYQSSEIVVECSLGNMTQIVFDCNSASYATVLGGSFEGSSVSSDKVTVTLDGTSNSFTIPSLSKQVRMDALTVTYVATGAVAKPVAPLVTANNAVAGRFVGSTKVEISCTTEDVVIYYTTNGDEPTEQSEAYNEPFEISTTTVVKAIAVNEAGKSNVATAEFTRVAADPVLVYDAASFDDELTVSVTSDDDVYYTLDASTPNAKSTLYEGALTLKATAILKVIAIDADGYASTVVEQKFTKNENASGAGSATATLVTDVNDLAVGDQIVIVGVKDETSYALSTNQKSSNRGAVEIDVVDNSIKLNADVEKLILEQGASEGTFAFKATAGYLYAASSSNNQLKSKSTIDVNGSWAVSIADGQTSVVASESSNRNVMQFNYNNGSPLFACYASATMAAVSIYKVNKASIEAYTLTVGAAGWATLFLNYDAEIPEGVTCYAVASVDGEYAILTNVEGAIPANTAVIVEAMAGEYVFEVATEAAAVEENMLDGTVVNTYISDEAYVLGLVDGEVGLYKAKMAGGVWLNNANKAYLPASVAQGAASYSFRFGEGTTGISEITDNRAQSTVVYDLTGRRVENISAPGIYIVNGKKVLVK